MKQMHALFLATLVTLTTPAAAQETNVTKGTFKTPEGIVTLTIEPPEAGSAQADPCSAARADWAQIGATGSRASIEAFIEAHTGCPVQRTLAQEKLRTLQDATQEATAEFLIARCDAVGAKEGNPDNPPDVRPVPFWQLDGEVVVSRCSEALKLSPANQRVKLQLSRGLNKLQNYSTARPILQGLINESYAAAFGEVGDNYQYGDGLPVNLAKAVDLYVRGVELGDGGSAGQLASLFQSTKLGEPNFAAANRYADIGIARKDAHSYFIKGSMLRFGQGVNRDYGRARQLLAAAIDNNSLRGHFSLAALLDEGKGGPVDYQRAGDLLFTGLQRPSAIANLIVDNTWNKEVIKRLQINLRAANAYNGPIDGILGPKTRSAIQSYQKQ